MTMTGIIPADAALAKAKAAQASLVSTRRGLVDSNPGIARLSLPPSVWATPPTVTLGAANAASVITGSVGVVPWASTDATHVQSNPLNPFRYLGGAMGASGSFPYYWLPASHPHVMASAVEFELYGDKLEFIIQGKGALYWIMADGQYVTSAPVAGPTSDGNGYLLLLDFGSVGFHRIRFWQEATGTFAGVRVGPNASVLYPSWPKGPRVVLIGDSFTEGIGATNGYMEGYMYRLGDLMGWPDIWASGSGGTGYLNPGTGGKVKYRDRIVTDCINAAPDIVIITGGINDQGTYTQAAIQTEAALLFAQIRAALPNATLIVWGPQWKSGSPVAALMQTRDAVRAAATVPSVGAHLYIESIGGAYPYDGTAAHYVNTGWMTGSGYVGATTGSGNSDVFTWTDATHPTTAGHLFLARRLAAAIGQALPL